MPAYPSPVLVVGVGRFGLATLEHLGEDWALLRQSGGEADASLGNLRLLWIRSGGPDEEVWRCQERNTEDLAVAAGEGDLPSLALDLAILRSLGLVRYRDGAYQIAVPHDAGVVDIHKDPSQRVRRRRFFDWRPLSPDPIAAVERLRRLAERHSELDLFLTPILNRVRQGHSPRVLLAVIARCRALAEGRDPAPWSWLKEGLCEQPAGESCGGNLLLSADRIQQERDRSQELAGWAPEPFPGWRELSALKLTVPPAFVPRRDDPVAPFDPFEFLRVDWEATGWASEPEGLVRFEPVDPGSFSLGLFDHDSDPRRVDRIGPLLQARLRQLAAHVYRGLLRLWIDLQRDRVEELDPNVERQLRQERMDAALQQSLSALGILLVRPVGLLGPPEGATDELVRPGSPLPAEPSRFLAGLLLDAGVRTDAERALGERLAELGFERDDGEVEPSPLLRTLKLDPAGPPGASFTHAAGRRSEGLLQLRKVLNEVVRQLYDFSFLTRYRDTPTRRPPRLTVYVVGDMGEPFTRAAFREVLREVHAELLRAFSPIFQLYREGFNRCLSVVPILWMPHPADPFAGEEPSRNRREEAVIIDAVHSVRRWVESVLPANRRRVSQIFVNSRVTDNAVLSLQDAVLQTRDFLSLLCRNDPGDDDWLRRVATGPGGDDLFSSFACYEIDFPAERCRDYLANRLARACFAQMRRGRGTVAGALGVMNGLAPPDASGLAQEGTIELERLAGEAGRAMQGFVLDRIHVSSETPARELLDAVGEGFERSLLHRIHEAWTELTRRRGRMDDLVAELRRRTSDLLPATVARVQELTDGLIEERTAKEGFGATQAGFEEIHALTREELQRREEQRRRAEDLCRRHRLPDTGPVRSARAALAAAAARKPDLPPLKVGLVIVALMSLALGSPLAESAAWLIGGRGPLALVLGGLGALIGGALLCLLVALGLQWHLRRSVQAVQQALEDLGKRVLVLFHGAGQPAEREAQVSVRTFFEARLGLTSALATRGYALRVFEQAAADRKLLERLIRSIDIQAHQLAQAAEALGVRPAGLEADGLTQRDDLRSLFSPRPGEPEEHLIGPERLHEYFGRNVGGAEGIAHLLPELIRASGDLGDWRKAACLADRERIMAFCRGRFDSIVSTPLADQGLFAEEAGERLCRFVARRYPNIGFGAKFIGYEGLDPDGVRVSACASLLVPRGLRRIFDRVRRRPGAPPTTDTMEVLEAELRPNAAYMVSLVQGIRAHSVRNLRRFESFHDRIRTPDDRTFPLAQEAEGDVPAAINHLSGYEYLGDRLHTSIVQAFRNEPLPELEAGDV